MRKLLCADAILLEAHEHFIKQTLRNRCHILSPNGVQTLVIPVRHQNLHRTPVIEVMISNDIPWQRQHWRSLTAAYRRSAFFEFYEDDFRPFYEQPRENLFHFNLDLLNTVLKILNHDVRVSLTQSYEILSSRPDYRNILNSGRPADSDETPYPQVFSYKGAFTSGLSIIDLIFNTGPAAKTYLTPMLF